jgi:hypothetical protein
MVATAVPVVMVATAVLAVMVATAVPVNNGS